jgi:hypothetical protein
MSAVPQINVNVVDGLPEAPQDDITYGRRNAAWVDMTSPANLVLRQGTAAEVAAITPFEGEPVWVTDTKALVVGDGESLGGVPAGQFPLGGVVASGSTNGSVFTDRRIEGSSVTAGNPRGPGSIDLQIQRTNATQVAAGESSAIIAGGRNATTVASGFSAVVAGSDNFIDADNSGIVGSALSTIESPGDIGACFIGGGQENTAYGDGSAIIGGFLNRAGEEFDTEPGGVVIGGSENLAKSVSVVVGGIGNVASGIASTAIGGFNGTADRYAMLSHSGGTISNFTARGQAVEFVMKARTTNTTPTEMLLATAVRLVVPVNVAMSGVVEVFGIKESDGANAGHYLRKFVIRRIANTTALLGSVTAVGTDYESDAGLDVAVTADDTNESLKVEVTGLSTTNIRWVAVVRGVEIAV